MKRLLLAGAATLALALGASACASVDPDAAVVQGVAIKARHLEADAAALASLATDGATTPLVLAADGQNGVRSLLSFEVQSLLLETNPRAPITVDEAAVAAADQQIAAQVGAAGWGTVPAAAKRRIARAQAIRTAAETRAQTDQAYNDQVGEMFTTAVVKVNPRYGVWSSSNGQVVPADVPLTER
jgi:hypothetical protein